MEILGSGKDGLVVYPPINCSKLNINKNDYVGKVYFKSRNLDYISNIKNKIDRLPDNLDGMLYYKENYLCKIIIPDELKSVPYYEKKLSDNQLILKRVQGDTLGRALNDVVDSIKNGNNCKFYELLKASILAYYYVRDLASLNIFYNDYSLDNLMYDDNNKKLMLVDLDDISYDSPMAIPKNILFNDNKKEYNPNYYYDDKFGYAYWNNNYTNVVIKKIIISSLQAYNLEMDEYMINEFDEPTKQNFLYVKDVIENIIGKPYNTINYNDIDLLNNNLEKLRSELCVIPGGKKHKMGRNRKYKPSKKQKTSKGRKTRKTSRKYKKRKTN